MNTTLSSILILLLAGTAITKFMTSNAEEQTEENVQRMHSAQVDQAEQLAVTLGLDLTAEEAFAHFYGKP